MFRYSHEDLQPSTKGITPWPYSYSVRRYVHTPISMRKYRAIAVNLQPQPQTLPHFPPFNPPQKEKKKKKKKKKKKNLLSSNPPKAQREINNLDSVDDAITLR